MPLRRRRHQVALYRSLIKVLTPFSPHFDPLFTLIVFPSLTHPFCLSLSLSLAHFRFILSCRPSFAHRALSLSLSCRLGRRGAPSELKGDRSNGRQHGGEVLQLQHTQNVSSAAFPSLPPSLSPAPPPPAAPLICSIDGRAQLNLGQWCTNAHNST